MAPLADDDEDIPEDFAPAIVAESTMTLQTMSVASAVIELDTERARFFPQRRNEHLNIIYRRRRTVTSAGSTRPRPRSHKDKSRPHEG